MQQLGVGASQLPKLLDQNKAFRSLKGGPTEGGETIGINHRYISFNNQQ